MKVFRQNSRPDDQWVEIGDIWIDPDRDPLNAILMCVDIVKADSGRRATYKKLAPQMSPVPPSETLQLKVVVSGTAPTRSIQLVVNDGDGDGLDHTIAEIMY